MITALMRFSKVLAVLMLAFSLICSSVAEEYYVLCKPGELVNVREYPSKRSEIVGVKFFGGKVETDGKERNGYLHIVNIDTMEVTSGWIYKGLLVEDEPKQITARSESICEGRVACRVYMNGKVRKWLDAESSVTVYAVSEQWCYTDCGYVKTECLSINP